MIVLYVYLLGAFIMYLWTRTDDFDNMHVAEFTSHPHWLVVVSCCVMSWYGIFTFVKIWIRGRYAIWYARRVLKRIKKKHNIE